MLSSWLMSGLSLITVAQRENTACRSLSLCPWDVFDRLHFFLLWSTNGETLKYSNIYYTQFSVRNLPFTHFQYIILEFHFCFEKPKAARRKLGARFKYQSLDLPTGHSSFHQNPVFQNYSQQLQPSRKCIAILLPEQHKDI